MYASFQYCVLMINWPAHIIVINSGDSTINFALNCSLNLHAQLGPDPLFCYMHTCISSKILIPLAAAVNTKLFKCTCFSEHLPFVMQ